MSRAAAAAALAGVLAATHPGPAAAQEPFAVEDVLSYSFASGLVASPSSERIAWVENDRGSRNVWVAEGPDWRGRRLTSFVGDDGQDLTDLEFTPDGRHVLFVRGQGANRAGWFPDPLSTPAVERTGTWIAPFDGSGEARELVDARGIAVHPSGDLFVYPRAGAIWRLDFAGDAEAVALATIRSGAGSLRWSPDGSRIAFRSGRGDHAFIGVLEPEAGTVTWLDPSTFDDSNPVWSPDGTRVAFLRQVPDPGRLPFVPVRSHVPFSIRVADAATGEGREVWTAARGPGSAFSGVGAANQLLWAAGERIVFPWEGDGWKHLYAVPASGGAARLLTPGDFEVQFAALTPDRAHVLYDGNQGDTDRKHVWRVPVTGAAPEALTPGRGLEWGAVQTPGGAVAYHASSGTRPAHTVVRAQGVRHEVGPALPASFPADRLVEPEPVVFRAADGLRIHGQLFLPPGLRPGERAPAVVFFHGGSRRQMLLGFHHRGYYHHAYAFNQLLAARGYVVLSVNYRSGIGYGMEFREASAYGATGASEFNDVLGAGLYLQSRPEVDPDRIGLWGGSYGGYLTALGLARASDLFAAGVDLHGVHDWNVVIQNFVPSYDPAERPRFAALALASSPMADLDSWRSPVLLIHGDDDRNVPFSESVDLAVELARRDVPFEQVVFPDEVHGFLLHRSWVAAFEAAVDFFDRRLAARSASPTTPGPA